MNEKNVSNDDIKCISRLMRNIQFFERRCKKSTWKKGNVTVLYVPDKKEIQTYTKYKLNAKQKLARMIERITNA